ncbi:hypothetical protein FEDK69T_14170 [Flavobacterium enshiense DK69]|nr:hypothetical protein [Flavobacterium enshiense]ESU23262.1 hypothetical protein FEDK69T_14170 [Flavobacterium enshiense DK69]
MALFLVPELYAQEKFIVVKDSVTNETLPYTSIDFQNGYGLFTDENGKAVLNNDMPNKIKITYVGYASKIVSVDKLIGNQILLRPEVNMLNEVKISASRKEVKKQKKLVVKPSLHDNIDEMYWSSIGQQFAFYVPSEKANGILKSVTIPLIVKDLYQGITESSFEDNPYGTMVRFEFMRNSNMLPNTKLYDYEKIFVIQSDKISKKIEVGFEESIPIPDEGFFVVMTVIGKTDIKGEYVPELPFVVNDRHGEKKKSMKIILPNYPLVELSKRQLMLVRNLFSDTPKWNRIERPMVYKKDKKYPPYTIGIGYVISY